MIDQPADAPSPSKLPSAAELAAGVAARLCHDFISPASAIVSGLDLLEDPDSQDMREEAMSLIADSARKLAAHLSFARIAFGASAAATTFDTRELKALADGVFAHVRAELDWAVTAESVSKPAARALLNMAQIGAGALPTGGVARLTVESEGPYLRLGLEATGQRVRMRAEVAEGLKGEPLGEGLPGHWVQAFYLHQLVQEAGGTLELDDQGDGVRVSVRVPG